MKTLVIRINQYKIIFIDLYNEESLTPLLSFICAKQVDVDRALKQVNDLNIKYQIVFKQI